MSRFLIPRLEGLKPYVPGEQPADMAYIKLNTNESPYPPSPGVFRSAGPDETDRLRLYPDPEGAALKAKMAARFGVGPQNIFLSNGSDEALAFIFMGFFDDRRPVVFPDVTYGFYPVYCGLFGIPFETVPLREDFSVDCGDYTGVGKNIVLANPNAPTGLALSPGDIRAIVESNRDRLVVVDEAYVDFGASSAVGLIGEFDNLLVVQTCSKSRSLAGVRLGFVFGSAPLIADIEKIRYSFNSYNVTRPALSAGEAAFDDAAYYADMQRKIMATRDKTAQRLRALGFEATDSQANFLFARHPGFSGRLLYERLRQAGILVRRFDSPRISEHLRITVGTDAQMDALCAALETILNKGE